MPKGLNFKLSKRDLGLKSFSKVIQRDLRSRVVAVGVFSSAGADVALRAAVHEFGSPSRNIPSRSFIRSTLEEKKQDYRALLRRLFSGLLEESIHGSPDIDRAFGILGQKVTSDMREKIRSNIPPPLKPATIARKGSSVALIDTGRMIQAISYKVEK